MFVLNFSHCNEARARSGKRDDIYEGDRKLSTRRRSPLRAKYFLDVWVKKECRERPPENDGWRVGAEEKKRKRGGWIWTEQMVCGICLLQALLFYST